MREPVWEGDWPLNAGWTYSSGTGHYAWDVGMPLGTRLFAPFDATVKEVVSYVQNNPPGYNPGSGSPVNYVLLWSRNKPDRTVLLNHLSPGQVVRVGQKVNKGQLVGKSGNTGNSTGPHLHVGCSDIHTYDQYAYQSGCTPSGVKGPYIIYPPDGAWKDEDMPLTDNEIDKIAARVWNFMIDEPESGKDKTKAQMMLRQSRERAVEARDAANKAATPAEAADAVWNEVLDQDTETPARRMLRQVWDSITSSRLGGQS